MTIGGLDRTAGLAFRDNTRSPNCGECTVRGQAARSGAIVVKRGVGCKKFARFLNRFAQELFPSGLRRPGVRAVKGARVCVYRSAAETLDQEKRTSGRSFT